MKFFKPSNLQVSRYLYIFLVSLYICIFINIPSFIYRVSIFKEYSVFDTIRVITAELLLLFSITYLVFCIFSFSKIVLKAWTTFILVCSFLSAYVMLKYNLSIDHNLILATFDSGSEAVYYFIYDFYFILLVLLCAISVYAFLFKIKIYRKNLYKHVSFKNRLIKLIKSFMIYGALAFISYFASTVLSPNEVYKNTRATKQSLSSYVPANFVSGLYQYISIIVENRNIQIEDITKKYSFTGEAEALKNEDYNVILIIGESARAQNHSIHGYSRNTNPYLLKEKNLIPLNNTKSCATISRTSVNCLLTYKNAGNFSLVIDESNMFSVFNSLGFRTSFLSTHSAFEKGPINYFKIASKDADRSIFNSSIKSRVPPNRRIYDEELLPFIQEELNHQNGKKFITLYLMGSHTPYGHRYPEEFHVFDEGNRYDDYDNSILYSDYIMHQIIDMVRDTNTIIYYASDHGESLGEGGFLEHGAPYETAPKEQLHIASFFWMSEGMKSLLPGSFENAKEKMNNQLSHDNIFHTMIGCIGVESELVDDKLNICK